MPNTMSPRAKTRMIAIILVLFGLSLSIGLALYGLSTRITYFYSPADLVSGETPPNTFRLGGMVADGTHTQSGLTHTFAVTDYAATVNVTYTGILPTLFREGQGIVANGTYDAATNTFTAASILAKHDENYMPPDVQKLMDKAAP